MRVLAFDTATASSSVALWADGRVVAEDVGPARAKHGETLLPRVQRLLEDTGLALAAFDLIAVGHGPGSFTGLRVGLATAKGLAVATGLPVRAVSTLEVLAGPGVAEGVQVATVLDAHKGEVFAAVYGPGPAGPTQRLAPFAATPQAASARIADVTDGVTWLVGDGPRRYPEAFATLPDRVELRAEADDVPCAGVLAELAAAAFAAHGPHDAATLEPLYLRGSDAKLPDEPLVV